MAVYINCRKCGAIWTGDKLFSENEETREEICNGEGCPKCPE